MLSFALLATTANAVDAAPAPQGKAQAWAGTWGMAPAGKPKADQLDVYDSQTLRLVVHTSIGGARVRIRLSNEYGTAPLRIGEAHIARRAKGEGIDPASSRQLRFQGKTGAVIAPGATLQSDPVELDVPALSDLAVSLYLPGRTEASTVQAASYQMSYVSRPGNFTRAAQLPTARAIPIWPFLTEVDVAAPGARAIVAFGDSLTSGAVTTMDANRRWPDLLAQRLHAACADSGQTPPGIVNRGIGGNRLLRDAGWQPVYGRAALARFDRDVLGTAGAKAAIVFVGINDLGHPGMEQVPASELPTAGAMIAGYRQLAARAHAAGIAVYGVTLAPFEGTVYPGYATPVKEAVRRQVNDWIRHGKAFDGVIDADLALRDPAHPGRLKPAYDSGDHLHPGDRGMQAIADAVAPLILLTPAGNCGPAGTH